MPPLSLARLSDAPVTPRRRRKSKTPEIVGIHPYALRFPMMRSDEQLADLADDIARNGQREPIDITPGGLIGSSCRPNKT